MKNNQPQYYKDAKIVCACGNVMTIGSTKPEIHVEICSACHPFFTGTAKLVDTTGRVERFKKTTAKAAAKKAAMPAKKERKTREPKSSKLSK